MHRALPGAAAILGLTLIAGCGTSAATGSGSSAGTATASAGAGAGAGKHDSERASYVARENDLADCMRQQGFTYIPGSYVPGGGKMVVGARSAQTYGDSSSMLYPDDVVRKWRSKYGFGVYSPLAYPDDPAIAEPPIPKMPKDPNQAVIAALDTAQRAAYYKARVGDPIGDGNSGEHWKITAKTTKRYNESCEGKIDEKYRRKPSAAENQAEQQRERAHKQIAVRYKSDPDVTAAQTEYANCLKQRGYPEMTGDAEAFVVFMAPSRNEELSVAAAKKELRKEIKAALDDLDCRSSYAKIVRTKYPEVASGEVNVSGAL
jgi:hypothetical protein